MSLRQKILTYVISTEEATGLDIERFSMANGQKGATGGRRARELAEDGLLEAFYRDGYVVYKKPQNTPKTGEIHGVRNGTMVQREDGSWVYRLSTQ